MKKILFVLLTSVLFMGCASVSTSWRAYPSYTTLPASVAVEVLNIKPEKPFTELGKIEAGGFGKAGLDRAIAKAKTVGADAIIILKEQYSSEIPGWVSVECVAIKYK